VRLDFTEHAGEDCGSAHAHPVRGSADLSTCHRPAHATWKRNVRPSSSSTSCSGSFGQMVASQPSHSLSGAVADARRLDGRDIREEAIPELVSDALCRWVHAEWSGQPDENVEPVSRFRRSKPVNSCRRSRSKWRISWLVA
jgi:hypothetical protein